MAVRQAGPDADSLIRAVDVKDDVMREARDHGHWPAFALFGVLVALAALDILLPDVALLPLLVIPVLASPIAGGPRLTAAILVTAVVVMLLIGASHDDFSAASSWLHLLILLAAGAVAVAFARLLARWRNRLEQREDEFRLLAENASDVVVRVGHDGGIDWVSPSITALLGWDPAALLGTRPWDLAHPDDRVALPPTLSRELSAAGIPSSAEARFAKADGTYLWLRVTSRSTPDGRSVVSGHLADDEVRARQSLSESQTRYRLLAENSMDLVISLDMHAQVQWVSPSVTSLLGYDPAELVGASGGVLIHPDDLSLLLDTATEAREGKAAVCRIRLLTKAGDERWTEAVPRGLYDDSGELFGGVIGVRDIDVEIRTRHALDHEIDFDALTGLAKRAVAVDRIDEVLRTRHAPGWALLCLGVDDMTTINQAYGYTAGDAVLKEVAERLTAAAGANDRVARIAGDEFVLLLRDIVGSTDAASQADRILAAVRGPVAVASTTVEVTACLGIAMATGESAEDLLRDSAAAMRQAGRKGRDRWEFLDGNVGTQTRQALEVRKSLREALAKGRIQPWLMPIVSLVDGRVSGYEALVRWILEDGTIRNPVDFLDIAERSGLIIAVDRVVLSRSLDALSSLQPGQSIAVNVSAASLASEGLGDSVRGELARTGAEPARLHLEVTETALLEVTHAMRDTMTSLAGLGISWWVDDFGTGFSSISHLRDLPIAGLKLDQTFTDGVTLTDSHSTRLAKGLAGLANGLGLLTIAEGVETFEQAQVLAEQGWQCGQGWLYGRAAPPQAA
jgi:diguanylate cyclase (GGDEF)-like protein/PAS domain S-box-containing protein